MDRAANTVATGPEFYCNLSLVLLSGKKVDRCGVNALLRVSTRPAYDLQEGKTRGHDKIAQQQHR